MKKLWISVKLLYMRFKINWLTRRDAQDDMKEL